MRLLVGLILTALIGPVGTESRGVAIFTHRDTALNEPTFLGGFFYNNKMSPLPARAPQLKKHLIIIFLIHTEIFLLLGKGEKNSHYHCFF